MSGGVDSSTTASILKKEGYAVFGLTLNLYSCDRPLKRGCCTPIDRLDARKICEKLEIPFETQDCRSEFKTKIIDYFAAEYRRGRTPLPCAPCNSEIRFQALLDYADKIGAYWIATGHYARVEHQSERSFLLKGKDPKKDQSYFLFSLKPELLKRLLLPLGELAKSEVRAIAKELGLAVHDKKDSQELCFLSGIHHDEFIRENYPEYFMPSGNFVNEKGKVLGRHRGLPAYTLGQRRGLEVSLGKRQYVVKLDTQKNEVILGDKSLLRAKGLVAANIGWTDSTYAKTLEGKNIEVKIRSTHPGVSSVMAWNCRSVAVDFKEPQFSVVPGQAVVFYEGERLLGGGWIEEAICDEQRREETT